MQKKLNEYQINWSQFLFSNFQSLIVVATYLPFMFPQEEERDVYYACMFQPRCFMFTN